MNRGLYHKQVMLEDQGKRNIFYGMIYVSSFIDNLLEGNI